MRRRTTVLGTGLAFSFVMLLGVLRTVDPGMPVMAHAQPPKATKYVGLTKCAACHFSQYKDWKNSDHGKAFEILPSKYKKDAACLKCHTTGFGQPSDVQDSSAIYLAGVSCEACHGPGGDHASAALRFVDQQITDKALELLRSKIQRIDFEQCVKCHQSKAHKVHPKFDREEQKRTVGRQSQLTAPRSRSFFKVHGERASS